MWPIGPACSAAPERGCKVEGDRRRHVPRARLQGIAIKTMNLGTQFRTTLKRDCRAGFSRNHHGATWRGVNIPRLREPAKDSVVDTIVLYRIR